MILKGLYGLIERLLPLDFNKHNTTPNFVLLFHIAIAFIKLRIDRQFNLPYKYTCSVYMHSEPVYEGCFSHWRPL